MSDRETHVVFGAGQTGTPLAGVLRDRGHTVRVVRRRSGHEMAGVQVVTGDAGDPAFATEAAKGATAVYHCMNTAYDAATWASELPRLLTALIAGAGKANAKLVVLDNLYMLGKPNGKPLSEDSAVAPCSRKGEIRASVNEQLFEAHRRGDVRATAGRASDFYGPGGTQTYFGDSFMPKALSKGVANVLADPDTPHTYHYTLDVARGLAALGTAPDDAYGRWWMLPCAPAETTRAMFERFGRAIGRELRVQRMSPTMIGVLKVFMPVLREIAEMGYQWDEPFVVDDRRFRERFDATATPLDAGVPAMVAWARGHYGMRSR